MRKKAFTLLELMLTLGLIAIVSALGVYGFNQKKTTKGLRESKQIMVSLIKLARSTAIFSGESDGFDYTSDIDPSLIKVRLMIRVDSTDASLYLRSLCIIAKKDKEWVVINGPLSLAEGVYFDLPEKYERHVMCLGLHSEVPELDGSSWFFYEFNHLGHFDGDYNRFALAMGDLMNKEDQFVFVKDGRAKPIAFYINHLGHVYTLES